MDLEAFLLGLFSRNLNVYENVVKSRANLDHVDTPAFIKILDLLNVNEKKNLRLTNKRVKLRVEDLAPEISVFTARSPNTMREIMTSEHIEGVHLLLDKVIGSELAELLELCKTYLRSLKCTPDMLEFKALNCNILLPQMEEIKLNCNYFVRVVVLSSDNCLSFPGTTMELSMPSLKSLNLRESEIRSTQENISFVKLKQFEIHTCKVTEQTLMRIFTHSGQGLKVLKLSRVGVSFESLAGGIMLPSLETLQIEFCEELTDAGLYNLLKTVGSNLKVLKLSSCPINCESLRDDLKFPKLETISVRFCDLSRMGLQLLKEMAGEKLKDLEYGS